MDHRSIAVVMPIYNREKYLLKVLSSLNEWDMDIRIYFQQDCPLSSGDEKECNVVKDLVAKYCSENEIRYEFNRRESHGGCKRNIPEGIEKAFSDNDFMLCIEDDVIVSKSFAEFAIRTHEKWDDVIVNSCRFSQSERWDILHDGRQSISSWRSRFFRSWGWACSRSIWEEIYEPIEFMDPQMLFKNSFISDFAQAQKNELQKSASQWNSDYIDSWALPFQFLLWQKNQYSISPYVNMSTHLGDIGSHYEEESKFNFHNHLPIYDGKIVSEMLEILPQNDSRMRELEEIIFLYSTHEPGMEKRKKRVLYDMGDSNMLVKSGLV